MAVVVTGLTFVPVASALAAEYEVRRGDTLSDIAAEHGTSWPEVYESNREVIGPDPDLIRPGQVLSIGGGDQAGGPPPSSSSTGPSSMPGTGSITSPYGHRTHPITGESKLHTGTDFGQGDGRAYVVRSGTVASVVWSDAYGNLVTIDHGDVQTRYAHLAEVWVSSGERVSSGDTVGLIGSTGLSTGAHLHFEVLRGGSTIDPMGWLR